MVPKVEVARTFFRSAVISCIGLIFYHAHLFFGILNEALLYKGLAIAFLLLALPLPIIAIGQRKLFPNLNRTGEQVVTFLSVLLFAHHFLMTFLFVLILKG